MIVFDSSSLILITKVEVLGAFLESIHLDVCIPGRVAEECCGVKKSLDSLRIQAAIDERKIRVVGIKDRKLVTKLRVDFGLGAGEAEAIVLAQSETASLVAIDDKNGINACKLVGRPFTTAIAILIRMREKRLLTAEDAMAKLTLLGKHGRYKQVILDDARRRLESVHD